jgi:Uma2 family endonuclease
MLSSMAIDPSLLSADTIRPLSRAEYERMVELGFFDEDEHVELLDGVLVQMSPHGWRHAEVIEWLSNELARAIDRSLSVRVQLPIALGPYSEPEPDIAVVRRSRRRREHPREVLLVIEVATDPARIDRSAKLAIYARAKIPEYWVVDLDELCVDVYSKPARGRYARRRVARTGEVLRPQLLNGVELAVDDLVG